jgi:hypothetical protein
MKYDKTDTIRKSSIKAINILLPFMPNENKPTITRIISSNALTEETFIPRPANSTKKLTNPEINSNDIIMYILNFGPNNLFPDLIIFYIF